jgi:hypothetical protein
MAANKKASATKVKGTRTPKNAAASGKVHTGRFINDEAYDEDTHDFGPWIMTPKSTRVGGFRYDFANRAVHVQWHGKGLTRSYTLRPTTSAPLHSRGPTRSILPGHEATLGPGSARRCARGVRLRR